MSKRKRCCIETLKTEQGTCLFGCNVPVDSDTGFCPRCHDHSANRIECETCGQAFEEWDGSYEEVS